MVVRVVSRCEHLRRGLHGSRYSYTDPPFSKARSFLDRPKYIFIPERYEAMNVVTSLRFPLPRRRCIRERHHDPSRRLLLGRIARNSFRAETARTAPLRCRQRRRVVSRKWISRVFVHGTKYDFRIRGICKWTRARARSLVNSRASRLD